MNPYINTEETEIDMLDLLRFLMRKIVWILLVGVICACLAGLFKYYRVKSSAPVPVVEAETEYALALEEYTQQSELIDTSNESASEVIHRQKDYLQNSLFMQLDPNHIWKAQTMIKVVSYNHDFPAYQFEELYKFDVTNIYFLDDIAKKQGTESAYLRELISAWSVGSSVDTGDDTSDVILRETDYEDRVTTELFYVQTLGSTEQEATDLMSAVLENLETVYEDYAQKYPHEFQILSRHCVEIADSTILIQQKDREVITQNLLLQMKDNKDKADLLKKPEEAVGTVAGSIPKKSLLKYGLVGFAAGIFLMCLWYTLCYMYSDKLVDYRDLEMKGLFLKELGSVSDQGVAMAAANIRNFAVDRRKLFLTGMTVQTEFDKVCAGLKEYLSEYEIIYARDALHDPKARELLLNCDAAVLVEQKGVTHYSELKEEATFLFNAEKEIIGIVIV